ncbi:MAG: MBL fold metallo-hydrolase [Bacteroidota bacterium]|nr:MBL fold metallo-hydrolase [Bacteroidota bacterium]
MIITFLGTGTSQGVPVVACTCPVCRSTDPRDKRLRSSLLVETDGKRIVIDCGMDFRQQMLREDIRSMDAILITHGHKDHLGGLDDVRAFNYILKRPADVYANRETQRSIKKEFAYAFSEDRYPGVPEINLHTINLKPFTVDGINVIPIKARHYNEHFVYGFRIGDFTYITDAVEIAPRELNKARGSRVVVINALRKQVHYSHFNLDQAVAILKDLHPEKGFITHISHQMGMYNEVNPELPDFINLAWDGLKVEF